MPTNRDSAASRNRNVETHLKNLNGCFHEETFTIQNPKQATKGPGLPGTRFLTNLCELNKRVTRRALSPSIVYCIATLGGTQYANCFRSHSAEV